MSYAAIERKISANKWLYHHSTYPFVEKWWIRVDFETSFGVVLLRWRYMCSTNNNIRSYINSIKCSNKKPLGSFSVDAPTLKYSGNEMNVLWITVITLWHRFMVSISCEYANIAFKKCDGIRAAHSAVSDIRMYGIYNGELKIAEYILHN